MERAYKAAERIGKPKRFAHINKLHYMKSFSVTMRHCRKKKKIVELYMKSFPLLFKFEIKVLKKVFLSLIH